MSAGASIAKKLSIKVISENSTLDLYRGIRSQLAALLDGLDPQDLSTMSLGLSHSLSRYVKCDCYLEEIADLYSLSSLRFKVKFSPDKVDTMIVQAIGLLDDLDKEINIYSMRVKARLIPHIYVIRIAHKTLIRLGMVRLALP